MRYLSWLIEGNHSVNLYDILYEVQKAVMDAIFKRVLKMWGKISDIRVFNQINAILSELRVLEA